MKKAFFVAFSSVLWLGCSDINNCSSDLNRSFVVIRFFDFETKESKKVGFEFTVEDSPYQFVLAADTTVDSDGDTTIVSDSTFIALPLNPLDTAATFLFETDTNDYVLQLRYDKSYTIFDPDCDPSLLFSGLDTLQSTFDSTALQGTTTNIQMQATVEVYF